MADRNTNMQAAKSMQDFCTADDDGKSTSWGTLLSAYEYEGFTVVKILNATCSGHCYGKGGPAEWLTVIKGEVVGSEATKRRATLIGHAVRDGHIERDGDTGMRLESYLIGMAVYDYEGPAPTEMQQREIDALLKD